MSKKDVIYLDIEDDVTAVIDKVKASEAGIIALVPPKRANMLGSVVNLKLLKRAATDENKKVVLITQEQVLASMAGGVGMFVAKDLKTPPSVPKVDDVELPSDVISIDGQTQPVVPKEPKTAKGKSAGATAVKNSTEKSKALEDKKVKDDKSKKIPDISSFRKKIFIGAALGILLITGIVWAFFFAPKATVTLQAATEDVPLETQVTLSTEDGAKLDVEAGVIPAEQQQSKEEISQDYKASGEKNVGNKASGTITISNCQTPNSFTVKQGTSFSSQGVTFLSQEPVTVPGAQGDFVNGCTQAGQASVAVLAESAGKKYNLSPTQYSHNIGSQVSADGGQMSGGTDEIVKVVDQSDIDGAIDKLEAKDESEALAELKDKFGDDGLIIIDESFSVESGKASASVPAGTEASGGKVTEEVTYSLLAIKTEDYKKFIDSTDEADLEEGQKIVDYDVDEVQFDSTKGSTYKLTAALKSGPDVDLDALEKELAKKSFSEAVEIAESQSGITGADIDLSPFWVFSMPRSASKITVSIEAP